jgi:hypothetical protein
MTIGTRRGGARKPSYGILGGHGRTFSMEEPLHALIDQQALPLGSSHHAEALSHLSRKRDRPKMTTYSVHLKSAAWPAKRMNGSTPGCQGGASIALSPTRRNAPPRLCNENETDLAQACRILHPMIKPSQIESTQWRRNHPARSRDISAPSFTP